MANRKPDALRALQEAKRTAAARGEALADTAPPEVGDLDEAECFVRLVIEMFASQLKLGMGVLPDGMAIWARLTFPAESASPYAGMVAFLISDDTRALLNKCVSALEASPQPPFWKPDRFAKTQPS